MVGVFKTEEQHQRLMEHSQPLKTSNEVCLVYLQCKLQEDRRSSFYYKLKFHKRAEIRYLELNKQQTRRHLRYLEVWELEKRCAWFFQSQRTKPNVNETFSAVKNKQ